MRTRTLLLLAVVCGTAILGAGAALFVQLAGRDDGVRPTPVNVEITVGDLEVNVGSYRETGDRFEVVVEIGGIDDPDLIAGFRLVTPNGAVVPEPDVTADPEPCGAATVSVQRCTLVFPLPDDPGTTRVLHLRRGEEQAWWDLVTT